MKKVKTPSWFRKYLEATRANYIFENEPDDIQEDIDWETFCDYCPLFLMNTIRRQEESLKRWRELGLESIMTKSFYKNTPEVMDDLFKKHKKYGAL